MNSRVVKVGLVTVLVGVCVAGTFLIAGVGGAQAPKAAAPTKAAAPAAQPPSPLGPLAAAPVPADNPMSADKAELGKKPFIDSRLCGGRRVSFWGRGARAPPGS